MADDAKQDLDVILPVVKKVFGWASVSAYKRVFMMLVTMLIFSSATYFGINKLANESDKGFKKNQQILRTLGEKNKIEVGIDVVNLCITSIQKKYFNQDYYCENADKQFKKIFGKIKPKRVQNLIKLNAYEYMVIDMKAKIRSINYDSVANNHTNPALEVLKLITSTAGKAAVIFLIFLIATGLLIGFKITIENNNQP